MVIQEIWNELGLDEIIGHSKMGSLVQLIVTARLLTQGSRRHIVGWSKGEAVEEILGIEKITTDDLYKALDWLDDQQIVIEHKLFQKIHQGLDLYLYDHQCSPIKQDLGTSLATRTSIRLSTDLPDSIAF